MAKAISISDIAEILDSGQMNLPNGEASVRYLLTDSRRLLFPNESLFFAIKGANLNGHDYLQELYDKGLRNFVVEDLHQAEGLKDANVIQVESSVDALQAIASNKRTSFDIPVIGITGSNGKTIVKEWLNTMLQADYKIVRSPKSYNSQIGVPLSVWMMNGKHNLALFEAGISEPGEMARLQKVIKPTVGIFTNIGEAHSEGFLNRQHKAKEKFTLFTEIELLIYCSDYAEINQAVADFVQIDEEKESQINVFDWSLNSNRGAKLQVEITKREGESCDLKISEDGQDYNLNLGFSDMASIENAMHCIALLRAWNFAPDEIQKRLHKLNRVAMRLELREAINDCQLINDSYNSDINSLRIALDFMEQQKDEKKTLILSDILESGKNDIDLYLEVANMVKAHKIDRMICIGERISKQKIQIEHVLEIEPEFFPDTESFLQGVDLDSFQKEIILIKGARKFRFERISRLLEKKVHETVLEVNLNALTHNLNLYRNRLDKGVKVMAMVKAFSYGSGAAEIARVLEFNRVDYLAVAYADEGVELRRAGIKVPILVLSPEQHTFEAMIQHKLEPEIFSLTMLDRFLKALRLMGGEALQSSFPIHLKIDTGMHRLGFVEEDLPHIMSRLENADNVFVKSILSHLSSADDPEHDDFTRHQIQQFRSLSDLIIDGLGYPVLRHILNSSGVIRFSEDQFDMVRLGIGLYGYDPTGIVSEDLEQVSRLRTTVSQVKHVKKGDTIGYGRMGKADRDLQIATVRIGYADGLDRRLSQGIGKMVVNGQKAPVIGNVCMDMCMIDVTDIGTVEEGDMVEVFGPEQPFEELAGQIGTIPYEVLTSISGRVKRVYFSE